MPQYWGISALRGGVEAAEQWMGAIHDAARDRGLTVQLCMAGPAHLLDSIDRPAATTIRTSIDYHAEMSKLLFWPQFHTVNLLASALGVWPFKDNFRTTEARGEQEALISILSAGMVGPSDEIGKVDAALILKTCRADGLLLKPDRPATPIDAMFLPHRRPFLVRTHSTREGVGRWTYLAAFALPRGQGSTAGEEDFLASVSYGRPIESMFVLPPEIDDWSVDLQGDLGVDAESRLVAWDWRRREAALLEGGPLTIPPIAERFDHAYFVLAPVFDNGLALIGELDKMVTVADRRFTRIAATDDAIEVELAGAPGERVTLAVYDADEERLLAPVEVTLDASGTGQVDLTR